MRPASAGGRSRRSFAPTPLPRLDVPGGPGGAARALRERRASAARSGGTTATMPTPRLNVSSSCRAAAPHRVRDQLEDRRRRPGGRSTIASSVGGSTRAQVGGQPAAGDVGERVRAALGGERQAVEGVDPGRLEQLVAERAAAEHGGVASQRKAGRGQHVAHERVAVGVQPGRAERDQHVASADPVRAEDRRRRSPRRRRCRRCRTRRAAITPGMLGGLAADERAAGLHAPLGDARHDRRRSSRVRPCRWRCSR